MDVWDSRPELLELQNQVMTTHWVALGLQLGLENDQLQVIRQQHLDKIADCRKEMYALWLQTKPNASRQQLLDALRTNSVNEVYMAEQYEKYIRDQLSQSERTHHAKDMSHSQAGLSDTLSHMQPYDVAHLDEKLKKLVKEYEELREELVPSVTIGGEVVLKRENTEIPSRHQAHRDVFSMDGASNRVGFGKNGEDDEDDTGLEIMDVWNSRPELYELQNQVMTTHWEALGLQLGLENDQLQAIRQQHLDNIADCREKMFALWLQTKPNASRQQLLDALRSNSVNEVYMAEQYEKYIRDQLSKSETTHHAKDMSHSQGGSSDTLPLMQPYDAAHLHEELVKENEKELREELIFSVSIGGEVVLKRENTEIPSRHQGHRDMFSMDGASNRVGFGKDDEDDEDNTEDELKMFLKPLPYMIKDPTLFADILSTYGLISNEVRDQVSDSRGCTNHVFLNSYIVEEFITTNRTSPQESVQQLVVLLEKDKSVLLNIFDFLDSMKNISINNYKCLWTRGTEMRMNIKMDTEDQEDERNTDLPEEVTELDNSMEHIMDENTRISIIKNGLVSLWTISSFRYHPTYFADEMYKHGLIPNEVKDGVYRLYETGKITDHHLKCRILQAVKDFIATNERENVQQVIRMNFKLWYKFAEFGIYSRNNFYGIEAMKDDLLNNGLWSREVEMHMNNRIYIDEEDERNIEDNEIPEEDTNLTNDKQATESDDSRVQYSMDEESCRSIIRMFEAHSYNTTKHMESDPNRFAVYLCAQAMIPTSLRNDIHTTTGVSSFDKASKILQEIQRNIEFNPTNCLKFVLLMIHYDQHNISSYGKTLKEELETQSLWSEDVEQQLLQTIVPKHEMVSSSPVQQYKWQYKCFLKACYDKVLPSYQKFPTIRNSKGAKQFINLALVHKRDCDHDVTRQSLLQQLHGNIDEIKKVKTPIAIHEVAVLPDNTMPRFILVEGAPGVGKTTLAWELCRQWREGNLLQKWELVVFIQLRNQRIRCAQSLEQFLHHPDPDTCNKVCKQLQQELGDGVMLVLDGFDELSNQQRTGMSFINRLLIGFILPEATLLITSRPLASVRLNHLLPDEPDQHIEVVGFSEDDIEAYIDSAFSHNTQLRDNFQTYIKSYPFAYSIMYIPLHCRIITEVYETYWKEGSEEFAPKTLTELYMSLLRSLMIRYLGDHPDHIYKRITLKTLNDLPQDVYNTLMMFAELAAKGIEKQQYVFNELPLSEHMGLMIQAEDIYVDVGSCVSYSFLHLTLQEFLAAIYWSQRSADDLTTLLKQTHLFPIHDFINKRSIKITSRPPEGKHIQHWPVLIFLAGIGGICSNIIVDYISEYIKHSQELIIYPNICKLLYETQSPQLIAKVLHNGLCHLQTSNSTPEPHSMLEYFEIGYCIACSGSECTWGMSHFENSKCLNTFTLGLKEGSKVSIGGGKLQSFKVQFLGKIYGYEKESFMRNLTSCFSQAKSLNLFQIYEAHDKDDDYLLSFQIATLITQPFSKLSEVSLRIRKVNTWIPVISAFSKIQRLKCLHLSICDIKLNEIYFLCDALKSCRSLVQLVLEQGNKHPPKLAQLSPIVALPLLTQLNFLTLSYMHLDDTISLLSSALQCSSCKLKSFNITKCCLTFESMVMLIKSLKQNHSIQKLRIIRSGELLKNKEYYTDDICFYLSDLLSCNTHINEIVYYPGFEHRCKSCGHNDIIYIARESSDSHFGITREGLISLVRAIESKPERKLILDKGNQLLLNDYKYSDTQIRFEFESDHFSYPEESLHYHYR